MDSADEAAAAAEDSTSDYEYVDWQLAVGTAKRLARPGPHATLEEIGEVVSELRADADRATPMVAACTGLSADRNVAPVLVVDRLGWVQANVNAFRQLLQPLVARLTAGRDVHIPAVAGRMGAQMTGVELGAVLAYLSSKVLGQFDPYHRADGEIGRLLLVAPNVVAVERELRVDPSDFRLWVCLHEETHRVQFGAVDWLEPYLQGRLAELLGGEDMDPGAILARLREGLDQAVRALRRSKGEDVAPPHLVELIRTPAQKAVIDQITALMTLLEGHADVVTDLAAPSVIPTLDEIRTKFNQRREAGHSPIEQLLRRLLGLEAKMRQYREGARFVRAVVDAVGMDGFNQVWTSPETLPTLEEITEPSGWLTRVAGTPPPAVAGTGA